MKAFIGTYFTKREDAFKEMENQNSKHGRNAFSVIEFSQDKYMVVSNRQVEAIKKGGE